MSMKYVARIVATVLVLVGASAILLYVQEARYEHELARDAIAADLLAAPDIVPPVPVDLSSAWNQTASDMDMMDTDLPDADRPDEEVVGRLMPPSGTTGPGTELVPDTESAAPAASPTAVPISRPTVRAAILPTVTVAVAGQAPPRPTTAPRNAPPISTAIPQAVAPVASVAPARAFTRIVLPRIGVDAPVVLAPFKTAGGATWDVPPFKAGHAEHTAGPGEPGNAVVFGHVSSIGLGNVFETLDRAAVGDLVQTWVGDESFTYRVVEIRSVDRADVSVLSPTNAPSVSLITCTGIWLPHLRDFSQRLVVRAELIRAAR
jgi:LPXTG-site transpeptidase (sortase) family protein